MKTIFLGEWKLQPERSEYTHGTPPRKATYEFKNLSETDLEVCISWTDGEGKRFKVRYQLTPDGKKRTYENPAVADEVMSEFASDNVLNSSTFKNGRLTAFATRVIDEHGEMKVVQRMFAPDGTHFDNIQFYQRYE